MSYGSSDSNKKFEEALHLLNEAAREKKEEIQELIGDKYSHIKEALQETAAEQTERINRLRAAAGEALELGGERVSKVVADVDQQVKENPWPYIGGVAVGALLLGFILGASRNSK